MALHVIVKHVVPLRGCFNPIPTQALISDSAMRLSHNASEGDLAADGAIGLYYAPTRATTSDSEWELVSIPMYYVAGCPLLKVACSF